MKDLGVKMCQHCGCLNPSGPDLDYICPNTGKRKERDSKTLAICECETCRLRRGEEPDIKKDTGLYYFLNR